MKRIPKSSSMGRLVIRVDGLFRQVVLKERPHKCEWCGRPSEVLQIAHILPKGTHPRLRYRRENVLLLDFPCHPERWHKNPAEAMELIRKIRGENYIETLREMEGFMSKHDKIYLLALQQKFREELKLC